MTTLWMYCVGCWHDGRVVFWQIDHTGIPRAAKLMKYETDGHRYKEKKGERGATGWLYNQDGYRQECKPDEHTILKPLFGAHLLKRYPQARVNIVESEKTALVMANFYGQPDKNLLAGMWRTAIPITRKHASADRPEARRVAMA